MGFTPTIPWRLQQVLPQATREQPKSPPAQCQSLSKRITCDCGAAWEKLYMAPQARCDCAALAECSTVFLE